MKITPLVAAALSLAALTAPALADDTAPGAVPMAAAFTIDTPVEVLMADERAKAVVKTHLPAIDEHPAYNDFKMMSLKMLQPLSQGMITDEMLAKIAADLAVIA